MQTQRQPRRRRRTAPRHPARTGPGPGQGTGTGARTGTETRTRARTGPGTRLRPGRRERPSAKRVLDLLLGSALLLLTSPLLAAGALALAVRRPPGGVLDRSPRTGLGGRVFVLYSLRTRRLRLDALSRLPHVVRGDLSLVGPEPLPPHEGSGSPVQGGTCTPGPAASPAARHWWLELKPGLTGLAQVRSRSGMPWDERDLLDQYYAEHHHAGMDLAILVRAAHAPLHRTVHALTRRGKARLSDTDHRRCGYSPPEEVDSVSTD
ncbi:sugar transferase [Streptomyces sp. NPDC015184]|uniref:sugar transferase n=1 Tax=Streptomyces sp. NPDC015184 TaxID=3364946 RepID=UPI0037026468